MISITPTSPLLLPSPFGFPQPKAGLASGLVDAARKLVTVADRNLTNSRRQAVRQATMSVGRKPTWLEDLTANARRLALLEPGWDGPGSVKIDRNVLFLAARLARDVLSELQVGVAPYLVPGGDGSVQLEWHEKHGELEFDLHPSGDLHIWGRVYSTGAEFEGENEKALALFYRWAPWMASPQGNEIDVPAAKASSNLNFAA